MDTIGLIVFVGIICFIGASILKLLVEFFDGLVIKFSRGYVYES